MLDRRDFLRASALTGAGLYSGSLLAKPQKIRNLRGGELLPEPDFSQLHDETPHLIGIRPYRTSGVRLELVDEPLNGKRLIHNYGHGGAGITLSWGCASVVKDIVAKLRSTRDGEPPSVAIMGTGIIGLTTATELKRAWPDLPVTVYAKDLDLRSTVSYIAGGQFEPSGMHRLYTGERRAILHDYVRRAHKRILEIQRSGQRQKYGVAVRKNYCLDRKMSAFDEGMPKDVVPKPRRGRLPFKNLNVRGREYSTFLMTPYIVMPQLCEDLMDKGAEFETREFKTIDDVAKLKEDIVINCTGYGAKALFNDEDLMAQRGHNVRLKKTDKRQFYFLSGGCKNWVIAYYFCRQDDIVVGGTIQKNNDSLKRVPEDDKIFKQLLDNGRAMFAGRTKACVRPYKI